MPSFLHAKRLSATQGEILSGFLILFLTRGRCHLCDEARPVVRKAAKRAGAIVEEVDIDTRDELIREYGLRIPVVLGPHGDVVAEGLITDWKELERAISRSAPA